MLLVLNHLVEVFQSVDVRSEAKTVDLNEVSAQKGVTSVDIANLPFSGRDLSLAMKLIPGVLQDPLGGLHLGGGANQVLYTLDGFNITDPVTGALETRLNIDSVRSLQFSAGRYSAEFGKGSAGRGFHLHRDGNRCLPAQFHQFCSRHRHRLRHSHRHLVAAHRVHRPVVKGRAWFSESADGALQPRR